MLRTTTSAVLLALLLALPAQAEAASEDRVAGAAEGMIGSAAPEVLAAVYPPAPLTGIVVMPFENLSGFEQVLPSGEKEVTKAVAARGWTVTAGDAVKRELEADRVRYYDSLPAETRTRMLEAAGAAAVLTGVYYNYTEGRNPSVAVSARLVRADGTLAWANVAALTSADTERAFGFGRKETREALLEQAIAELFEAFPVPGKESGPVKGRERPVFRRGAVSYRAADVDPMRPRKVCILPFENASDMANATRIMHDVLSVRLPASTGLDVVEPATLRGAAVTAGIGTFRDISTESLKKLAPGVGTSLFLKGTVYEFFDPAGRTNSSPEVQVELTLIDVEEERVIWSAQHEKVGDEYSGFLMLGAESSSVSLADRVVAEMIEAALKPSPAGEAGVTARGVRRSPENHSQLRGPKKR